MRTHTYSIATHKSLKGYNKAAVLIVATYIGSYCSHIDKLKPEILEEALFFNRWSFKWITDEHFLFYCGSPSFYTEVSIKTTHCKKEASLWDQTNVFKATEQDTLGESYPDKNTACWVWNIFSRNLFGLGSRNLSPSANLFCVCSLLDNYL